MLKHRNIHAERKPATRAFFLLACLATVGASFSSGSGAAATVQEKLDAAESKIEKSRDREQVLTSEIEEYSSQISALSGQVASLRQRESAAEAELEAKQAEFAQAVRELKKAIIRLRIQRARLQRALKNLGDNLVTIYTTGPPDIASIALAAENFGDLVATGEYLESIQNQSEDLAERVRILRNQAQNTVAVQRESKLIIETARDEIASREQDLETTRTSLESRQANLAAIQGKRESALGSVRGDIDHQEELAADLRAELEETIAAVSSSSVAPSDSGSSTPGPGGMIWPVDGVLSSTFGPRWGSVHEGIDISAPGGTPIKAAASGTVILMQSEAESGGYGNYTCVDHGGGLSTCYAHQSEFGTTEGASVSQGDVIGYVGNTGHSFGDHLHFEVRIDGVAQDPLGYL
ncbi:MAG TPA: peptidoglycan DD-metalloendopeptidase family protein [Solirubrobacterales bacterium]|nr:peptidoglycan DD-metalloendopeptidase family protein [Solirubrobacterales bacterium]